MSASTATVSSMRQPRPTRVSVRRLSGPTTLSSPIVVFPSSMTLGRSSTSGADLHLGADVGRGRIPHRDAGGHVRVVDATLHDAGRLGQLAAGVHAQALLRIARLIGEHGPPAARLMASTSVR